MYVCVYKHMHTKPKNGLVGQLRHDLHYGVDATAIAFPHTPEAWLSANVPQLHGHVALGDLAHVEADGWDHVLRVLP